VREPGERLGAGSPGSDHDMAALRAHPFFAGVSWETLWTDPAPPLEAGLVKRPPTAKAQCAWNDIGAAWDDLVGDEPEGDGIEWAEDAGQGQFAMLNRSERVSESESGGGGQIVWRDVWNANANGHGHGHANGHAAVGGEVSGATQVPNYVFGAYQFPSSSGKPDGGSGASDVDVVRDASRPEPFKAAKQRRDLSAGSGSSSDGSPVERLGATLESMSLKRGRDQSLTPVQGNRLPDGDYW
jgi:3-phosphoinositide dependent protein kinase-1